VLFNTLPFLIFLAVILPLFWFLKSDKWRHLLLFAANFFFYGWWDWRFTALLLLVVAVSHAGSWAILRWKSRWPLYATCGAQLVILGYFKYAGFFADNLRGALSVFGLEPGWTTLNIILPVGISFYIFQSISYLVSVYRGTVGRERSFLRLGVYLGFFPHLVAGPIIHASTFLPQLQVKREFALPMFVEGWRKFAIGFLYKSVFADNIALAVDRIFSDVTAQSSIGVLGGCLGFYAQIYFDFAGYSLMAIGVANMFGYHLPDNFNFPYRSASVVEFWRRWHISLSTWLRDYVYIPLGGNRGSGLFVYRNLMITMFLGGLWHGADWNFVLWGCLHGGALCLNHLWRERVSSRWPMGIWGTVASIAATQVFVLLCWVPFRAESFADTLVVYSKLTGIVSGALGTITDFPWMLILLPLVLDTWVIGSPRLGERIVLRSSYATAAVVALALLIGLLFMHLGYLPFIYFQF